MKKTTNCLNCGSNDISLDIKLGQLKCNHCDSLVLETKYQKEVKNLTELKDKKISKGALKLFKNIGKTTIKCETCGTIMHSRYNDSYTKCRMCGSTKLKTVAKIINNEIEYILPFSSTKEDAMPILKHYIEHRTKNYSKKFLKNFKKENVIPVYIPYPIFDIDYDCETTATGIETLNIHKGNNSDTIKVQSSLVKRKMNVYSKGIYVANEIKTVNNLDELKEAIVAEDSFDTSERIKLTEDCFDDCYILEFNKKNKNKVSTELLETLAHISLNESLIRYDREIHWENTNIKINNITKTYIYLPVWLYFEKKNKFGKTVYQYIAINGRKLTTTKYNKVIDKISSTDAFVSVFILFVLFGFAAKDTVQSLGTFPTFIIIFILATLFSSIYNLLNNSSSRAQELFNERYKHFKSNIKNLKSEDKKIEQYDVKQTSGYLDDIRVS